MTVFGRWLSLSAVRRNSSRAWQSLRIAYELILMGISIQPMPLLKRHTAFDDPNCDEMLQLGVTPGVLTGWTTYLIAAEEIHWRIHLGERLSAVLRWSRAYHFTHHDCPNARYNVFFPLFDFIFGSFELGNAGKKIAQAEPNTERAAPFPLK